MRERGGLTVDRRGGGVLTAPRRLVGAEIGRADRVRRDVIEKRPQVLHPPACRIRRPKLPEPILVEIQLAERDKRDTDHDHWARRLTSRQPLGQQSLRIFNIP